MSHPIKMQVKNKYTELSDDPRMNNHIDYSIKPGTGKVRKKNTHLTLPKKKRK